MKQFFSRLSSRPARTRRPLNRRPPLVVEALENRLVPTAAWPAQFFAPYVNVVGSNENYDFPTEAKQSGAHYFALAFINTEDNGQGQPSWEGETLDSPFDQKMQSWVDMVRKSPADGGLGGDVMVSFGGDTENSTHNELATMISDPTALFNAYDRVIQEYQLNHVDFDIEGPKMLGTDPNSVPPSVDIRSQAIKMLQAEHPDLQVWFTVQVGPGVGLIPQEVGVLQSALNAGVNIAGVNLMTMDYGDGNYHEMEQTAEEVTGDVVTQLGTLYGNAKTTPQLWQMIGITPQIGKNDSQLPSQEDFTPADAVTLASYANNQNVSRVSMWTLNQDHNQPGNQVNTDSQSGDDQTDYQYSQAFEAFGSSAPVAIPAAPSGVSAATVAGQVTLNWTASAGATSYHIYRGTSSNAENASPYANVTTTSFTDTAVNGAPTYYYFITAVNSTGESPHSAEVNASPPLPIQSDLGIDVAPGVSVTVDAPTSTDVTITLNGQTETYTNISTIEIFEEPGSGSSTISVKELASGMTVYFVGNSLSTGQNTITVGNGSGISSVQGQVRVDDFNNPKVILDDSGGTAENWTLKRNSVNTSRFEVDWQEGSLVYSSAIATTPGTLTIQGGAGSNLFTVRSTKGELDITSAGYDTVKLGNNGSLADIGGLVHIDNSAGTTFLTMDDSADPTARTITMDTTSVTFDGYASVTWSGVFYLGLKAGSGGNHVNVVDTIQNGWTDLVTGTGSDTVRVAATTQTLNIIPGAGNNEIDVAPGQMNLSTIQGQVLIDGSGGNTAVSLFDQAKPHHDTYTITSTSTIIQDPATITYTNIQALNLYGAASGTYNIQGTPAGATVTIYPGTGSNTFSVVPGLQGLVLNGVSTGPLMIDDSADTGPATYTITATTVQVNGLPAITYTGAPSLIVKGGSGTNTFNVLGTTAATPVTLDTGTGTATVNVGNSANSLDLIQGALTVQGQGGSDLLNVNDSGAGTAHTYTVSVASIARNGMATIAFAGIQNIALSGGPITGNLFVVSSTAAGTTTTVTCSPSAFDEFVVEDNAGTMNSIQGNLFLHGQAKASNFALFYDYLNSATGLSYTLTNSTLNRTGTATITFTGLVETILYAAQHGAAISVPSSAAGVASIVLAGNGSTVTVGSRAPGLGGTVANILGNLVLQSYGGQTPTMIVDDSGDTVGRSATLKANTSSYGIFGLAPATIYWNLGPGSVATLVGGSGANTYAVQSIPSGVAVHLNGGSGNDNFVLGTAARGLADLLGPLSIDGGGGNNTVLGPDQSVTWALTGSNSGQVGGTRFSNIENLVGGSGADTFLVSSGASLSGRIDGGGGNNTLDYSAYRGDIVVNLALATATNVTGGVAHIANVTGSQGNDILVGDANPNVLRGGTGCNLLIGGGGADQLFGGGGDNIQIGGTTAYDLNPPALMAIMQEFSRTDENFHQRLDHLANGGGLNGSYLLNTDPTLGAVTVFDDGAADVLNAGGALDWFFSHKKDDVIVNRQPGDKVTQV
jgi:hypothetical protein